MILEQSGNRTPCHSFNRNCPLFYTSTIYHILHVWMRVTYCPNCEGAGEATKALQAAEATELELPKHHFTNDQHIFLEI